MLTNPDFPLTIPPYPSTDGRLSLFSSLLYPCFWMGFVSYLDPVVWQTCEVPTRFRPGHDLLHPATDECHRPATPWSFTHRLDLTTGVGVRA